MADSVFRKTKVFILMALIAFFCTTAQCEAFLKGNKTQLRRSESQQETGLWQSQQLDFLKKFLNSHSFTAKTMPSITNTTILHRKERNPRRKKFANNPSMFSKMFAAFNRVHKKVATTVARPVRFTTQVPGENLPPKASFSTRRKFPNRGFTRKPGGIPGRIRTRPGGQRRPGGLNGRSGMRRRRPGGMNGKPGLRRKRPGRPEMDKLRPGGFTGRPGFRRMRPGGLTGRPGMRRMRPGGFTGRPGMRRMRPGGFTGRPGMRRTRPGGFTGRPGMRRTRPGGFTGRPGMRRTRPGGITRRPGIGRTRPHAVTRKPGILTMRPNIIWKKPSASFTRKPPIRTMRPNIVWKKPSASFIRKPPVLKTPASTIRKSKPSTRQHEHKHTIRPSVIRGPQSVNQDKITIERTKQQTPKKIKKLQTAKTHSSAIETAACQRPPHVINGHFTSLSKYHHGSKITYTCKEGYKLTGIATHICQLDGQWSGDTPTCVLDKKQEDFSLKGGLKKLSEDITNVEEAPNGKTFIVGAIGAVVGVLLLICHCLRVSKTRGKLLKMHKEVIEDGLIPTRDVPGLCEVSNGLLKKCCCCCGKSGLPSSFRPQSSKSVSGKASKNKKNGDRAKSSSRMSLRKSRQGSSHRINSKTSVKSTKKRDALLEDDETNSLVNGELPLPFDDDLPSPPGNMYFDVDDVNDNSLSNYWNYKHSNTHRRRPHKYKLPERGVSEPTNNCYIDYVDANDNSLSSHWDENATHSYREISPNRKQKAKKQIRNIQSSSNQAPHHTRVTLDAENNGYLRKKGTVQKKKLSQMEPMKNRFERPRQKTLMYKTRMGDSSRCKRDKIYRTYRYDNKRNRNVDGIAAWSPRYFNEKGSQELKPKLSALRSELDKDITIKKHHGQNKEHDHHQSNNRYFDSGSMRRIARKPVPRVSKFRQTNFSDNCSHASIEDDFTFGIYKTTVDLSGSKHLLNNVKRKRQWYAPKFVDHEFHGEIMRNDSDGQADKSDVEDAVRIDIKSNCLQPELFYGLEHVHHADHLTPSVEKDPDTNRKVMFCTPKVSDVSPPYPTSVKTENDNYNCPPKNIEDEFINKFDAPIECEQTFQRENLVDFSKDPTKDSTLPSQGILDIMSGQRFENKINPATVQGRSETGYTKSGDISNKLGECISIKTLTSTNQMLDSGDKGSQNQEVEMFHTIKQHDLPNVGDSDISDSETLIVASTRSPNGGETNNSGRENLIVDSTRSGHVGDSDISDSETLIVGSTRSPNDGVSIISNSDTLIANSTNISQAVELDIVDRFTLTVASPSRHLTSEDDLNH